MKQNLLVLIICLVLVVFNSSFLLASSSFYNYNLSEADLYVGLGLNTYNLEEVNNNFNQPSIDSGVNFFCGVNTWNNNGLGLGVELEHLVGVSQTELEELRASATGFLTTFSYKLPYYSSVTAGIGGYFANINRSYNNYNQSAQNWDGIGYGAKIGLQKKLFLVENNRYIAARGMYRYLNVDLSKLDTNHNLNLDMSGFELSFIHLWSF